MSYTSETIFQDSRINAIADRIYELLYEALPPSEAQPEDYIYIAFVLSGKAANILQGATASPINNVTFQTSNAVLFKWCSDNLAQKLNNSRCIRYNNRILVYPFDFYFEILFSEVALLPIEHNTNIYIQDESAIPAETL